MFPAANPTVDDAMALVIKPASAPSNSHFILQLTMTLRLRALRMRPLEVLIYGKL